MSRDKAKQAAWHRAHSTERNASAAARKRRNRELNRHREAVEQAIARGQPTLTTMHALSISYDTVKYVRDKLETLNRETEAAA